MGFGQKKGTYDLHFIKNPFSLLIKTGLWQKGGGRRTKREELEQR